MGILLIHILWGTLLIDMADYPNKDTQPIVHKDFGAAVKRMYPNAMLGVDVIVVDHSEGMGTQLARWNLPYTIPTNAEINSALEATPEEIAFDAYNAALIVAKAEAKADNIVQYLRDHTLAECAQYVQDNVTDLASAKAFLKKVAIVLCALSKESLR